MFRLERKNQSGIIYLILAMQEQLSRFIAALQTNVAFLSFSNLFFATKTFPGNDLINVTPIQGNGCPLPGLNELTFRQTNCILIKRQYLSTQRTNLDWSYLIHSPFLLQKTPCEVHRSTDPFPISDSKKEQLLHKVCWAVHICISEPFLCHGHPWHVVAI